MKKNIGSVRLAITFLLVSTVTATMISALEVDKTELESAGTEQSVVFENYTGPHTKIDSLAQIKGIGSDLGTTVAVAPNKAGTAGDPSRYYVIHAVDPSEKGKLDADIIFIGSNATVDHIRNLRHIIAAYLMSAYNYSESDAETIAVFTTVYNAVYRGKLDIYTKKYKNAVLKNLTAENCGLALNYKEWPGKSQIVIPLSDIVNGGLSTVDTSVISDKQVVQSMRQNEDKGIADRKNMVDIKEREADTAAEKAQQAQKQAVAEQSKLAADQQKLETSKQDVQRAEKEASQATQEAQTAQQKAAANPQDEQAQKQAAEAKQNAQEKQAVAGNKQEAVKQQEAATAEQAKKTEEIKQEAAVQQDKADKKQTEAQDERTSIAKDQQSVIDETSKDENVPAAYGLKLVDSTNLLSRMIKINAKTGKEIKESPVTVIRNRTLLPAGDNYMAIAGENGGNGTVKLVLLDTANMEIVKESTATVSEKSVLVQDGDQYYCIIKDGATWVLGKYDSTLKLLLKSSVAVTDTTPVSVSDKGICVTAANGNVKLLRLSDLTEISEENSQNKSK